MTDPVSRLRGTYDVQLAKQVGRLLEMSRREVEAWVADEQAPLIAELQSLHERPLPPHEDRKRRLEIREERAYIDKVFSLWKDLHRPEDAGPNLVLGR